MTDTTRPALPPGWVWTTIGEVTNAVRKVDPEDQPTQEFVYLDISAIDNTLQAIVTPKKFLGKDAPSRARQQVEAGDVLFSTVRTYLKNIAIVSDAYDGQVASTGFSVLRTNVACTSQFLFYWTLTEQFLTPLGELQRGSSYPAVRDSDVRRQSIPLAPLAEQRRIVAKIEELFTELDAGVVALKRAQANLRRYKASVLKAACEGRLVSQDPSDEPADALLQRILAERRARHSAHTVIPRPQAEESELQLTLFQAEAKIPHSVRNDNRRGRAKYVEPAPPDTRDLPQLPKGWVWVTMEQIAEVIGGVTKGRVFGGKKTIRLPYLRVANVQRGELHLGEVKEIELLANEVEKYRLCKRDLVLTEGGDWDKLGRSAIWNDQIPLCVHQNHIFRARPYLSDISTAWMMFFTNSEQGQSYFKEAAKQTTNLASINLSQLRQCPLPLPPFAEQQRIVAEVERRLSVAAAIEATLNASLARAERMRQAILRRAFAGQLVPQDPNDEPASALLERLRVEHKPRLVIPTEGRNLSRGRHVRQPK